MSLCLVLMLISEWILSWLQFSSYVWNDFRPWFFCLLQKGYIFFCLNLCFLGRRCCVSCCWWDFCSTRSRFYLLTLPIRSLGCSKCPQYYFSIPLLQWKLIFKYLLCAYWLMYANFLPDSSLYWHCRYFCKVCKDVPSTFESGNAHCLQTWSSYLVWL